MILGIEATNIRAGGGITHLKELLTYSKPTEHGFSKVIVWSGKKTLNQLPDYKWLIKKTNPLLDKSIFHRYLWMKFHSKKEFDKCSLLFTPGGLYSGHFKPYVSMSQNMLVFEQKERARFGISLPRLRLKMLSFAQKKSFKHAEAVIFISLYAKNYIEKLHKKNYNSTIVYHGVSSRFKCFPRPQKATSEFSKNHPFKLLYVSIINVYKHQKPIIEAVNELNSKGYHIQLNLVGSAYAPYLKKIKPLLSEFAIYKGKMPFEEIESVYQSSDAFIFGSTCENMPNILVEAMSAGLPIMSSNYGPMPEILKDNGIYFDPLNYEDIKSTILELYHNQELRTSLAARAYNASNEYSWEVCSENTFKFLKQLLAN